MEAGDDIGPDGADLQDLLEPKSANSCSRANGGKMNDYGGSYEWSVETQGYIVGATFLGGLLSTLPGGLAIDRYSIRHLLMISVLLLSIASILMPLFAEQLGPVAVMALRFLMGVGEGIMIPAINGMITSWIPLHEKSTAASVFTSGNQLAAVPKALGYRNIGFALVCCVAFHCEQFASQFKVIPWRSMATSPPLLVVLYSSVIGNMMIAMILVYIPVYFKDVLMLEVKQNGFYTALPHTCNLISKLVWGFSVDYLKQKKVFTATQTVKLSQVSCASYQRFGGRVATPQIITYFKTVGSAEEWRGILLVYSVMTVISATLFAVWGSGDVQHWNSPEKKRPEIVDVDVQMDSKPLMLCTTEQMPPTA
ncbi:transporter, major facilitator family protein [Ancylostoma ceylanicum]|uniref:Transporter, major facilitator family protein n=1 Tax=Ancylostoma ceylanicum TaxID=53326 RepID=A0A0D6LP41_9BILA|nr:transporter, major facilitator family protein [Ancylostoma ceylanicum]